jgi:hypothetical protein
VSLAAGDEARSNRWRLRRWTIDLPYRAGLPTVEQTRSERERWLAAEGAARAAGEGSKARDCRSMVERMDRLLTRLANLPPGPTFPMPVSLLQLGDAFWLTVEGEHYQLLQRSLRARFLAHPILVVTLADGTRCSYLPSREAYGKGIYQETVAVLAPGSLESLIEAIGRQIEQWAV